MREYLIILFTALFLSSCGLPLPFVSDKVPKNEGDERLHESSDQTFSSYVEKYEQQGRAITGDSNFKVEDIPINFGDTENPAFQGVCFEYPDGKKEIIIRKSWWDNVDQKYRESLLFHELGHCHLGREHLDQEVQVSNNNKKVSLMNSIIVMPRDFQEHESQYLYELFTHDQNPLIQSFSAF